ncbi:hypothetical protein ACSN7O_004837 [Enterobacter chuandaensis]
MERKLTPGEYSATQRLTTGNTTAGVFSLPVQYEKCPRPGSQPDAVIAKRVSRLTGKLNPAGADEEGEAPQGFVITLRAFFMIADLKSVRAVSPEQVSPAGPDIVQQGD